MISYASRNASAVVSRFKLILLFVAIPLCFAPVLDVVFKTYGLYSNVGVLGWAITWLANIGILLFPNQMLGELLRYGVSPWTSSAFTLLLIALCAVLLARFRSAHVGLIVIVYSSISFIAALFMFTH